MTEIRKHRERFGLTQKQMATMLNTPLSTYIKWDVGTRRTPGVAFAIIFLATEYRDVKNVLLAEYKQTKG